MQQTRPQFKHEELLHTIRKSMSIGLKRHHNKPEKGLSYTNIDCLMSGLAVFTFKFPSLLKFDEARAEDSILQQNLTRLFQVEATPCDTHMRSRLDPLPPEVCRPAFQKIFTLLQRGKVLDDFRFFGDHYLVSLDGTGVFSSHDIHCDQCCIKEHRDGSKTYYHQIVAGALVHPDQKVVFPFAPEPIVKEDGDKKNDCERNASKRWIKDFKREHPHLKAVILADGLASNAPFIQMLQENNLRYILVCQEGDHKFLTDWVQNADKEDSPIINGTIPNGEGTYQYMKDVPLNGKEDAPKVTVVRYAEKILKGKKESTRKWMWVTDLNVTPKNIKEFVKGARARWKIENETFNTLKNQGYEFEHNFGHGTQYLTQVFSNLMMLAFLVDQCLQRLNKRFQEALAKCKGKKYLWQRMLHMVNILIIPNFESLYEAIARPPTFSVLSVR